MTRLLKLATVMFTACLLASCATVLGTRQIELPVEKLQAGVDKRFPFRNRVLELFDIQLTRPQLTLFPSEDRVGISLDAAVAPAFMRNPWRGSLALSGRLYVDPQRGAVFINEPRVERFNIDGVDEARQRQLGKIAGLLVDDLVRDLPLYTFRPEELRYAGVQFAPTSIHATARGLTITVEPAR
jgi:hypothetical protein